MNANNLCLNFRLYHGTRFKNGETILIEKAFKPSIGIRHWLGDGIYFFETETDAIGWCLRYGSYMILDVDVAVKKDRFFDLTNKKHMEIFDKVMGRLLNETKKRNIIISQAIKIDGYVVNFINDNFTPIDVIKARFYVEKKVALEYKNVYKINPTRIRNEQIQYCVRYGPCIKNIRKKDEVL